MTLKARPPRYATCHNRSPTTYPGTSTVTAPDKSRLLKRVATASAAFEAARDRLHGAVHTALEHGASWSEIGSVLGVSRQAAFQRFGPKQALRMERGTSDT